MNRKKILAFFAVLTAAVSAMTIPASAEDIFGDINTDGAIDSVDAACILQYAAYVGAGGTLDLKAFLNGEDEQPVPDTDDTLTVMVWTDEDIAVMQEVFFQEYPDTEIEILQAADSSYEAMTKFKTVLDAGDPVDLYFVENSWARDYIDNDYALPLYELGFSEEDYVNAYPYARELGRGVNSVLYGAAYSVCPGGYCYNADLAEQYLGISTPEEMQTCISDWDGFTRTAADLHEASGGTVTMNATLQGMWTCFTAETTTPVLLDGGLNQQKFADYITLAQEHITNGYVNPEIRQWTQEWFQVGRDGETLGYFFPSWSLIDGMQLYQCGGLEGNWSFTAGPQEYYQGGIMICAAPQCDSRTAAENFIRTFTVDPHTMADFSEMSGQMVNNQISVKQISASGKHQNPLLGGQDEYVILHETAANLDVTAAASSEYDTDLLDDFFFQFSYNYDASPAVLLDTFATEVKGEYGIE